MSQSEKSDSQDYQFGTYVDRPDRWWSEEDDTRVRRKLDARILPFLFMNRSNIGNAKVAGMTADLHISDSQYEWLLTVFYIGYIVFQFLLICYKFIKPSRFMGTCVFFWGVAAILQATAFNWSGLMATRFFMALFEAGYGTGVALYLSFFYPRHEIGYRFAWFVVGSAVASAIAGSVAYGIQSATVSIANWRLIFLVEAGPTVILGVALFFFLPDSIQSSKFLTPYEREVAEARLYRAKIDQRNAIENEKTNKNASLLQRIKHALNTQFNFKNGADALKDPVSYINAVLLFIVNNGFASIPVYLPTILSQMGYTALRAQAFSAPPYAVAFVLAVILSYAADRLRTRGVLIMIMTAVGLTGYFMLATIEDNHTRYAGVWLVVLGLFTFIPLCYSWLITNSAGESKRGIALVIFGTIGQCSPLLGTRLFPATEAPYYRKGMYVSAGLLVAGFVIEGLAIVYFYSINRAKDKAFKQSASSKEEQDGEVTPTERPLQYQFKIDTKTEEGRQEQHLRYLDIAENREKSIYFRYSL
ncbi:MFS general substrate transporter [Meira miltonrushii]|uniref:MFS general substrate transporter n=1 Tax=Meira miltonrushii TaxID=1280837 RepID=A0A316V7L3_9BASI|nr:MFS general substrate transporter [Meira miltonrushii]PWN33184.1 MFS general substrate transporter [Meira miltonrushii]